jgi:hypothetical protein
MTVTLELRIVCTRWAERHYCEEAKMSEEHGTDGAEEKEANREELARTLNLKQKLWEKLAIPATRTLTDADIITSMNQVRVPGSALFGSARANAAAVGRVQDKDPRDPILYTDFDFGPDPVTVTDVDPTDSSHHPFP